MRKGIICAGNWIIDQVKTIDRYPAEGESCHILYEEKSGGGGPCNILCDLAAMQIDLPLYAAGRVGDDDDGQWLIEEMKKRNIDTRKLLKTSGVPTSSSDVLSGGGKRTFLIRDGANSHLNRQDFDGVLPEVKIFYLGYLLLLERLDAADPQYGTAASGLLSDMQKRGFITVVDFVAVEPSRYAVEIPSAMQYTDILVINELEAGYTTNCLTRSAGGQLDFEALHHAANCFFDWGVRRSVVFHYPEGAFVMDRGCKPERYRSFDIDPREIQGTNGAGDAFCAGILYGIHQNLPWTETIAVANASAWFNLRHHTASGGAASIKEIYRKINDEKLGKF